MKNGGKLWVSIEIDPSELEMPDNFYVLHPQLISKHLYKVYFIIPENDIAKHKLCDDCPCKPNVVIDEGDDLYIITFCHNAFDKREEVEKLYSSELCKN